MSKDLTTSSLTQIVSFVSVVPFLSHYPLLPSVFTSSFLLYFLSVANCFLNEIYLTDEIPYVGLCVLFFLFDLEVFTGKLGYKLFPQLMNQHEQHVGTA